MDHNEFDNKSFYENEPEPVETEYENEQQKQLKRRTKLSTKDKSSFGPERLH